MLHYRSFSTWHAALLSLGVLLLAYGFTPVVTIGAGEQDGLVFRGFHDLETAGEIRYRWSTGASLLALPQIGRPTHGLLRLQLWGSGLQPPVPTTLSVNGHNVTTLPIHGRRVVRLLIPGHVLAGGNMRLGLHTPAWSPPDDARQLGVAMDTLAWQGLGWTRPPVRQLWIVPGIVIGFALLLARLHRSTSSARMIALLVGTLLAIGAGLHPLGIAPYIHRLLLMVLLAHAGLSLWTALVREDYGWWHLPQQTMPGPLLVLLGIAYWMVLPFQAALCTETVPAICPRPGTQLIGSITLATLFALAVAPELVRRPAWRAALVVLVVSGIAEALYAAGFALRRAGPDFFIHWRAAYDLHLGRPLYRLDALQANHFGHAYKLPPFYVMLLLPLATVDDAAALLLHRVLNIVLYVFGGALLAWLLRPRLGWTLALATVVLLMGLMQPAFDTIAYGQVDIILLVLLILALLGLRSMRPWLVGLTIALAALIKLYPLLFGGLLLVRGAWKSLAWLMAWLVLLLGLAIAVVGWQNHVIYLTRVLPQIGGGTSWVENQTINGFLSRLLTGTMHIQPIHDRLIDLLTYAAFVVVTGVSLGLAATPSDRRSTIYTLQVSLLLVVMVLTIPAAWMHYATITIPAFAILIWYASEQPFSTGKAASLALAFGLIAYGNQWSFFTGALKPGLPLLALSYKGYGLTLLWGLMVNMIWHARTQRRSEWRAAPSGSISGHPSKTLL